MIGKEALSISCLNEDALNRDDVFITTFVNSKELIKKYYNEHYSESIKLKLIEAFDDYGINIVQKGNRGMRKYE